MFKSGNKSDTVIEQRKRKTYSIRVINKKIVPKDQKIVKHFFFTQKRKNRKHKFGKNE